MRGPYPLASSFFLLLLGCLYSPGEIQKPADHMEDFTGIWIAYQNNTVLFACKDIDWMIIGNEYYDAFLECATMEEFYLILEEMLAEIGDPVVCFEKEEGYPSSEDWVYPTSEVFFSNSDYITLVDNYLNDYGYYEDTLGLGYCDPELLPYVNLSNLLGNEGDIAQFAGLFIAECNDAGVETIIIDLRHQGTRTFFYPEDLPGRFTGTIYNTYIKRTRNGPDYDNYFDDPQAVQSYSGEVFQGDIILLTGEQIRGGIEWLCTDFMFNPNVVAVGDTTMGSVSIPTTFISSSDIHVRIPKTTIYLRDGNWLEGNGMAPDIFVETTPADLAAGTDPVFEYALELILR